MLVNCISKIVVVVSATVFSHASHAIIFNFNDLGGAAPGSIAGNAFQEAANVWSAILIDPIVVNLDIGFQALNNSPNVLAQASSFTQNVSYSDVRNALIADQTTLDDQIAVSYLQTGSSFDFLGNDPSGNIFLDNNSSINNSYISVNTALMKALNLLPNNSVTDASLTFNSLFGFDFDASDGITSGQFDFVGIAIHEIGHALGFTSGVDTVDAFSGNGPNTNQVSSFDNFSIFKVLDLYRYSTDSLLNGPGVQDLAIGDRGQYFSIDGGQTELATFSTGVFNGDGRQASHWRDNLGIGILDPTFSQGEIGLVSPQDVLAFDVIGYDFALPVAIPNPNSIWLFCLGVIVFGYRARAMKLL